jgi:hypothetical protein
LSIVEKNLNANELQLKVIVGNQYLWEIIFNAI